MKPDDPGADLTPLLRAWAGGEEEALEELLPLVYRRLRAMAGRYLQRERPDHTLQATALVHEAYLKLADQGRAQWESREQFFAVAAQAMRRILVDHARRHQAARRPGARQKVALDVLGDVAQLPPAADGDLLALDQALNRLAELDARQARVVELRFFGGLSGEQIAGVLGISTATVTREWRMARAWLARELERGGLDAD